MYFPHLAVKNRFSFPQIHPVGDMQVAARFLDAVRANPDDAWAFVSKIYAPGLDLNELRELLGASAQIMMSRAIYIKNPKRYLTRSIYVEDPGRNLRRLLHLRMVKEPDHNGPWKICQVVQEECVRI